MSLSWDGPEGPDEHIRNAIAILKGCAGDIAQLASNILSAEDRLDRALADMPTWTDIPRYDEVRFIEDVLRRERGPDLHGEATAVVRSLLRIHYEKGERRA